MNKILTLGFLLTSLLISAQSTDWHTLKTGAGGWLTGMDIHPNGQPIYVRSDVGGAYKYDATNNEWNQIVTASSLPSADITWQKYQGVLSLVSAPSDPLRAYMAYDSFIYKSDDEAATWVKTNLPPISMEANFDDSKLSGERLAVDPNNSDIAYFGSIENGLWSTNDGGDNWSLISDVPTGQIYRGIRKIIFDSSSAVVNGKTQILFVFVDGEGVFKSEDGGDSWTDISPSNFFNVGVPFFLDSEINNTGSIYICGENYDDNGTPNDYSDDSLTSFGVLNYNGSTWTQIYSDPFSIKEIAIDPFDNSRGFLFSNGYSDIYRSMNLLAANPNWTLLDHEKDHNDIPYLSWTDSDWFNIGEIQFDPTVANKLWIADGLGSWTTSDLNDNTMTWFENSVGQEHLVSNDAIALPNGEMISLHWDRPLFHHVDADQYPATHQPTTRFNSAWSIDQFPNDPNYLVAIIEDHRYCCYDAEGRSSGYSSDGGLTWTTFTSMPQPGATNRIFGEIKVSANDKNNIVWLPSGNLMPYYTLDQGNTWTQATLPGNSGQCCISDFYLKRKALTADRVLDNTFYIYDWGDGSIFVSNDGGQTWTKYAGVLSDYAYNAKLMSVHDHPGHLLFANGPEQSEDFIEGLSISEDGGSTWMVMANTDKVLNFAVGKIAPGGSYPTIYINGEANGVYGYHKSIDKGQTWEQIGTYPKGVYDEAFVMVADPHTYERLYVGFAGNGFVYYGDLNTTSLDDEPQIEAFDSDINIYPNPTNQYFVIQGELWLYDIEILNASGQVVLIIDTNNSEEIIDISTLGSGLYLIKMEHKTNSNLCVQKIIKE